MIKVEQQIILRADSSTTSFALLVFQSDIKNGVDISCNLTANFSKTRRAFAINAVQLPDLPVKTFISFINISITWGSVP